MRLDRKVTIRIEEQMYERLENETKKFGYRSLNSYIGAILSKRILVEVSGGCDLANIMHQIRSLNCEDPNLVERRVRLCQLYDSLMTAIETMRSCIESSDM